MNKLLAIMLMLAAMLFAAGNSIASGNDSTADANSNAEINFSTTDNSRSLPGILTPTKLDGSFVSPPQIYYDPRLGDSFSEDDLPPIYRLEGWKIFYSDPYKNGVKVKRIKAERKSWISNQESVTGERVNSDAEAMGDNDILMSLPYYPEDAREVAIAKVFLSKEKYIINQAVSEAWYHAWEKSKGAKYYVVLYNSRLVSQASVRALGSAMVGGASIDPQSIGNTSVNAISAGGGVGIGTAKAHIFKEPVFMVIALSHEGAAPQRLLKKEALPKEESKTALLPKREELKKTEVKEEISPIVLFEFDKYKITTEEQKKSIRRAAKKIAENIDKMENDDTYIYVVGSCSPEGTTKYNDTLGRRRAEEVYKYLGNLLIENWGIPLEIARKRIKFVSASELNPEFNEYAKQRNAAVFVAAKLKVKKE